MDYASMSPDAVASNLAEPAATAPSSASATPESLNAVVYAFAGVFFGIASFAILVRLGTHMVLDRRLVGEDYVVIPAWAAQVAKLTTSILIVQRAVGEHVWDITLREFIVTGLYSTIDTVVYIFAIALLKIAILLQLLRLFVPQRQLNRILHLSCWTWIVAILAFYSYLFISTTVECLAPLASQPIEDRLTENKCVQMVENSGAPAIFNIVSDVAILLLPLPTIWSLKCDTRKKLAVMGVFAVGLLACVTSIVRSWYTWLMIDNTDLSWNKGPLDIWTWAELCAGTLVFCLPVFPRFYRLARARWDGECSTAESSKTLEESDQVEEARQSIRVPYPEVSLSSWEDPMAGREDSREFLVDQDTTWSLGQPARVCSFTSSHTRDR